LRPARRSTRPADIELFHYLNLKVRAQSPLSAASNNFRRPALLMKRGAMDERNRVGPGQEPTPKRNADNSTHFNNRPSPRLQAAKPPRFVLTLQPLPGTDPIRALRWVLKSLLRQHATLRRPA
jgi:hypothetical protein